MSIEEEEPKRPYPTRRSLRERHVQRDLSEEPLVQRTATGRRAVVQVPGAAQGVRRIDTTGELSGIIPVQNSLSTDTAGSIDPGDITTILPGGSPSLSQVPVPAQVDQPEVTGGSEGPVEAQIPDFVPPQPALQLGQRLSRPLLPEPKNTMGEQEKNRWWKRALSLIGIVLVVIFATALAVFFLDGPANYSYLLMIPAGWCQFRAKLARCQDEGPAERKLNER